jgi:hypothetical protein
MKRVRIMIKKMKIYQLISPPHLQPYTHIIGMYDMTFNGFFKDHKFALEKFELEFIQRSYEIKKLQYS